MLIEKTIIQPVKTIDDNYITNAIGSYIEKNKLFKHTEIARINMVIKKNELELKNIKNLTDQGISALNVLQKENTTLEDKCNKLLYKLRGDFEK